MVLFSKDGCMNADQCNEEVSSVEELQLIISIPTKLMLEVCMRDVLDTKRKEALVLMLFDMRMRLFEPHFINESRL